MHILQDASALPHAIAESPVLLVQFGAETCAPCHAIRQRIDRWTARHPAADSLYISVPDFPALAAGAEVFSVPTVLVYVAGKCTLRQSGYFSLDALLQDAERYLALLDLE